MTIVAHVKLIWVLKSWLCSSSSSSSGKRTKYICVRVRESHKSAHQHTFRMNWNWMMNGLWLTEWLAEGPRISPIWYYEAVPSVVVKCFEHDTHLCLFNSSTQELNWIFLQLNEVFLFVSPSNLCQSSVQRRRRGFILSRGIGWHNLWPTKESASLGNNSIGHRLTSNLIIDKKEAIPNWIRMRVLVTELRKNLFFRMNLRWVSWGANLRK